MSGVGKELTRALEDIHKRIDDVSRLVLAQTTEAERIQRLRRDVDWIMRKLEPPVSPPAGPARPNQFNSAQTVFVRNLNSTQNEEWLREQFAPLFGRISKIFIPRREDGETVHGIVHFEEPEAALQCLNMAEDLYNSHGIRVVSWQPKKRPRY